ncbi:PIN domain-containing protein [Algoriphagus sp. C2-6-M1]|uniref:PIN domain-containing protein n=1 Tax=Algoriphagus persicinus TaxID=3108754 RepID=UPI002B3892A2|nr:PIN domain-containing protein [Algoriphagus sp. C2-6-M1]MEB2782737.1 PIN domain-containing protein [Algoriphagus sp. C2-6-M1]
MKPVLIDTSVWIEFLKGNPDYFPPMIALMEEGEIYSLELIFAELLQGVKTSRELNLITDFYRQLRILDQPSLIFESGDFSRKAGLINRGIGLIDAIIILAAEKFDLRIWTLDKKIIGFLGETGVYKP